MAQSVQVAAITSSTLPKMLTRADKIWKDARAVNDLNKVPSIATTRAVLDNQTARMPQITDRRRTPKMDIAWLEACTNAASIKTDAWVRGIPCDFTGWVVGSNKQEIVLQTQIQEGFNIPAEIFDNLFSPEELFNEAYAKATKNIAEKLNEHIIAKLILWAGFNNYRVDGGLGQGAGTAGANLWKKTKVPYKNLYPNSFNTYLNMMQRINKMVNPTLIEGGIMGLSEFVEGSVEKFRFGQRIVYSDVENFSNQGLANDIFVMSRGAVAVVTTYNNPTNATDFAGENYKYTGVARQLLDLTDTNGNPIMMDMYVKRRKKNAIADDYPGLNVDNRCEIYDSYLLEINFQIVLNPLACSDGVTGIVRITADPTLPLVMSPMQAVLAVQENGAAQF